jgi:ABC-2 type transport system ATP-binding protein
MSDVCEMLRIAGVMNRPVHTLSGGQQRCVHTAIALIASPDILLLDEPTVGVDVEHRQALLQGVRSLADSGCTVIYTTHYLAELELLDPNNIVVLDSGRIRHQGSIDSLLGADNRVRTSLVFDRPVTPPDGIRCRVTNNGSKWEVVDATSLGQLLPLLNRDIAHLRDLAVEKRSLEAAYLRLLNGSTPETKEELDGISS